MTILNNLVTEEIVGTRVLVSFDYNKQLFRVVDKETEDVLAEGSDISINNFLERNGARVFLPRYMSNEPETKVNANSADKTHFSAWAVLLYLKNRHEDNAVVEMEIFPRDYQEGLKFLPGIKIPLGECLIEDINKSSIANLLIKQKDFLKDLKKIAVRTYKESDNREVALIAGTNKYYPFNVDGEEAESFANSLVLVVNNSGIDIDEEKLKKALSSKNTMSVLSADEGTPTLDESLKFDEIINKHVVVFESRDLNSLSRTLFHVHPEASYHGWRVSEIKENAKHDGFLFEVFGESTDAMLNDDFILGRLLVEDVYITHKTPLHNSSLAEKAVFSLMHGASINEVTDAMLNDFKISKKEITECGDCGVGLGSAGMAAPVELSTGVAPVVVDGVPSADLSPSTTTSADFHGIQNKVLYPMINVKDKVVKKKAKGKKKLSHKESLLSEMGILGAYNKLMRLAEDDDIPTDSNNSNAGNASELEDFGGEDDTNSMESNNFNFGNMGDSNTSDSDSNINISDFGNDSENTGSEAGKESEESEGEELVGTVESSTEEGKLVVRWSDDTTSLEDPDNLLLHPSKKQDIQI